MVRLVLLGREATFGCICVMDWFVMFGGFRLDGEAVFGWFLLGGGAAFG